VGGKGGDVKPLGPRPSQPDGCERLQIETHLMSPQREVTNSLKVGDVLQVNLRRAPEGRYVVALNALGQVAGTIGSDRAIYLIECLDKGYVYVADVLSLDGGACRVLVHREGR
jgi:hypothetical protein